MERNTALYGVLFYKYNEQSGRFNTYSRGGSKIGQNSVKTANGAEVSGRAQQTGGVKFQSRDNVYLTDEQIADLKEHDMTLNDFKNRMFRKLNIVKRENAERSLGGGWCSAIFSVIAQKNKKKERG